MKGGGREPHIVEDKNYSICASRGRFLDENGNRSKDGEYCQRLELNTDGVSNTLTTVQKDNYVLEEDVSIKYLDFRVRKLTPRECWRLMGIKDSDFDKASQVVSNSQLYKQAGNAIVVDVLYYILKIYLKKGMMFNEY